MKQIPAPHKNPGIIDVIREYFRPLYLRNIYFRAFPSRKPAEFDNCWNFPHVPVAECLSLLDKPIDKTLSGVRDFLIFPMTDWHARIQRSQFFAKTLAAFGHRCFLLNPHLGREFRGGGEAPVQLARLAENIYELHVRLPREPVYHHRNLSEKESQMLCAAVLTLIEHGGLSNVTQLVSFPGWFRLAQLIKSGCGSTLIYDCHDRLDGFTGMANEIVALEPAFIAASDWVICSAESLRAHCVAQGAAEERCIVVRNAVTANEATGRCIPPIRVAGAPPVIGYLGALEEWFDGDTIRSAAVARPDWRFVIAGRVESPALNSLLRLPNVEFTGEIAREKVPEILSRFDVATIPFRLNPLTLGADPIKLYEYLAAGLPVVSSRLPETLRFENLMHYYDNAADFVRAIELALAERGKAERRERKLAVKDETWESRCLQILGLAAS